MMPILGLLTLWCQYWVANIMMPILGLLTLWCQYYVLKKSGSYVHTDGLEIKQKWVFFYINQQHIFLKQSVLYMAEMCYIWVAGLFGASRTKCTTNSPLFGASRTKCTILIAYFVSSWGWETTDPDSGDQTESATGRTGKQSRFLQKKMKQEASFLNIFLTI